MSQETTPADVQIDPRGYRFGAAVTLVLSVAAVVLGVSWPGIVLMFLLAVLFLPGATVGPQATLQALVFKKAIRPRLGKPTETESFRPPRFAQQMGLGFSILAIVLGVWGPAWGYFLFAGFVAVASFLNSVFGFCLGCEIYLVAKRATTRSA
jgi:hypothetical protein